LPPRNCSAAGGEGYSTPALELQSLAKKFCNKEVGQNIPKWRKKGSVKPIAIPAAACAM
jgi:hypothetical protein